MVVLEFEEIRMQIFYNAGIIRIVIPVDYDKKNIINKIFNIVLSSSGRNSFWLVEGLFLNHAVEEENIFSAQERLKALYDKKCKKMNIAENDIFQKDKIMVTKTELMQYFFDFANCYMEITARPQKYDKWIVELGTEADANYIYVCIKESGKVCIQDLVEYIGIEKLSHVQIERSNRDLEISMIHDLIIQYPEIQKRIDKQMFEMEKKGWFKSKQYIKSCYIRQEKVLVYELKKVTGEYMKLPVLKLKNHYKKLDIRFGFK